MNVQIRENFHGSRKPTKKCAMKMKEASKNDAHIKVFLMEEAVYKTHTEKFWDQLRRTPGQ